MSDNGLNKNSSTIVYENNTKNIYKELLNMMRMSGIICIPENEERLKRGK